MKHILFFALKEDILAVLELAENKEALKYVQMGNFACHEIGDGPRVFSAGNSLPNLGKANADQISACVSYLICLPKTPINLEQFKGNDGTARTCIDQLRNPDSVTITPGGIWNQEVVIHGRIASASETNISQDLIKRFQTAIKKPLQR